MRDAGLDVAPARLGGRGSGGRAAAIAILLAALVVVAIAKPWAAPSPNRTPRVAAPTAQASVALPAQEQAPPPTSAEPAAVSDPISTRNGWDEVSWLVREVGSHGGDWGVGGLGWGGPAPGWVDWKPIEARVADEPDATDAAVARTCSSGALRAGARAIAVSGPTDALDAAGMAVWSLRRTPLVVSDGLKIVHPVETPGVAFLVLGGGEPWPDGAYRLIVRSSSQLPAALDVCVGTVRRGTARSR